MAQRSDFHKGIYARRENWLSARGFTGYHEVSGSQTVSRGRYVFGSFVTFVPVARYDTRQIWIDWHVLRTKQGAAVGNVGEVLPAAETAEPELGPWSVFCESAATLEAKAGHHNPEQRSDFCKRPPWRAAKIG